jgi:catechol 2,3-dioxygenase-like lactoylglutathione lyase family enzyme
MPWQSVPSRSFRFYRDVLGFDLLRDEPMGSMGRWIQLALQGVMLNSTDIDRDHQDLNAKGLELLRQPPA